ncbi:hypothetical protein PAEPH01_2302 [Pancytospora epiphaga]|nr:hypothetical protein PAEPH01_2302 [Pancytospora epiphaga]
MEKNPAYVEIRSKYIDARTTKKLCAENKLRFRHGFYSRREAGLVQTGVDEFLKERELKLEDLTSYLVSEEPFPIHDLVQYVTQRVPYRTFKSVDTFITWFYNPLTKNDFESEDDRKLLELVEKKGYRWKEIGAELEQVRARCRIRFLRLKGLYKKNLLISGMKSALKDGIPTTDAEWERLCTSLGHSRVVVEKFVNQYMKRPILYREKDTSEIILSAYVLKHNFYCGMEIDIKELTEFVENCDEMYRSQGKHGDVSKGHEEFFQENFNKVVFVPESLDLEVDITVDDIFWTNIVNEYQIFSITAKSKFYILRSTYEIYTFRDLYEMMKKLTREYFYSRVGERVLEKVDKQGTDLESSVSIEDEC